MIFITISIPQFRIINSLNMPSIKRSAKMRTRWRAQLSKEYTEQVVTLVTLVAQSTYSKASIKRDSKCQIKQGNN